jgi:hypothetical protein
MNVIANPEKINQHTYFIIHGAGCILSSKAKPVQAFPH